jgi:putative membrane-bound dehydrogenase-like protein
VAVCTAAEPLPTAENFPPKSPEESLLAMVPRPGFEVELMAAEPFVADPVDIAWGPDGKLWVVEMADYPLGEDDVGKPCGRVRFLEDTDSDGRYDRSVLFLENLAFPNGVMPWRRGILVTCAPDVLYAEDTNGDGKADVRRSLYTGFGEGNQQHRVNHPRWGLDNWVYLANGDGGAGAHGVIQSVQKPDIRLDIRGRDLRIRPDEGLLDTVTGQSQFGRNRDDWGNWFGCNNADPGWFYAVDDRYLRRNPHVASPPGRVSLTNARTCYPAGRVVTHHALGQACPPAGQPGSWTSLAGVTVYRDEMFGLPFYGNVFVSDSVFNIVHRMVVWPDGVLLRGDRARDEQRCEFLCSTDPWFRPAALHTGPDGSLWVVDMYRFVIEHPQWINDDLEKTLDLRLGHDKGRLWRIYPKRKKPRSIPRLDGLDTAELVAALDSPNGWQRDTVQQMLIWRGDKSAVGLLEAMVSECPRAVARLHALCTLDGLGLLRAQVIALALHDRHPGVRRHAARLSETFLAGNPALGERLAGLADDLDPQVRMQVAYTLGEWDDPRAGHALGRMALRYAEDPYLTAAVMSSAIGHLDRMVLVVAEEPKKTSARARVLGRLLELAAAVEDEPDAIAAMEARRAHALGTVVEDAFRGTRTREEIQRALNKYQPALSMPGDPARGKKVFVEATCSTCHRLEDTGTAIGPDLTSLVDRSPQVLHVAVIDPNRAKAEKYLEYLAVTDDGFSLSGMLVEETSNSLTLVDVSGKSHVILRKDLEELACLGRSHMPEKLEDKLSVAQMADLFAFIRQTGPQVEAPLSHQPEVVGAESDGSLRLLARKATISACRVTFDPQQQCLIWHAGDPDDHVSWLMDVPSAGTYDVLIDWTQIPEYADNPFLIEAGSSRVTGRFPSTGGWGRWQKKQFGRLQLAAGRHQITLRPGGPIKGELSDLREIHLVPAEAQQ